MAGDVSPALSLRGHQENWEETENPVSEPLPLITVDPPNAVPARDSGSVRYLLVNPPLISPANPYHSISYLVGKARHDGFTGYRGVDANIDALRYMSSPDQVRRLLAVARTVRERISRLPVRTRWDEFRFQAAVAAEGVDPGFVRAAIDIFQDPERFYHYPTYRQAVTAIRRWLTLLTLDGLPGMFDGFGLRTRGVVNYSSFQDLSDRRVIDAIAGPFLPYIRDEFAVTLDSADWEVIGFSVSFRDQLPFALRMARAARERCPRAVIVFGGTEICDDVKYTSDRAGLWRVFGDADLLVPGEGETPLTELLRRVRDGRSLDGIPGVIGRDTAAEYGLINYERVADLPSPAYDIWDWGAYWVPEPVVLYSPTRGCYWNKCTFCDYGLNTDRPTSPSRERPVDRVLTDLGQISEFGRTVYFAVDAMSPRYLRSLSTALAESATTLRWSAELRLERTFPSRGMAELLARAGCVAVSFGYESGSQRILDLIDKGVRIDNVPPILADLRAHGIGAQMMGFTGFPSETGEEAVRTYRFLQDHRDLWTIAGIGRFQLTPGSIVAKQPARFGVTGVAPAPAEDIARTLTWNDSTGAGGAAAVTAELRNSIIRLPDDRPFVGGIDSAHSLLYFARYGPPLLPAERSGQPGVITSGYTRVAVPFADLDELVTVHDLELAHEELRGGPGATYQRMTGWLGGAGAGRPGRSEAVTLPSGVPVTVAGIGASGDTTPRVVKLMAAITGAG